MGDLGKTIVTLVGAGVGGAAGAFVGYAVANPLAPSSPTLAAGLMYSLCVVGYFGGGLLGLRLAK